MSSGSRLRRAGWIAALATCLAIYLSLHLKVHAVRTEVIRAERQIVALEQQKLLLETEFETRANQRQLAAWNSIDFGYTAPTARQFLDSERQLVSFGGPSVPGAPEPIRVAGIGTADEPDFPRFVSPLTGEPVEADLLRPEQAPPLAMNDLGSGATRIQLGAVLGSAIP